MSTPSIERRMYDWVADVGDRVGTERLGNILGGALSGVARTKATLDKNLDALLAVANIPSRRDYRRMQSKLDSLHGSVTSLSRTVEQLRAALENGAGRGKATAKAARAIRKSANGAAQGRDDATPSTTKAAKKSPKGKRGRARKS